jgi:tetrahydromethanopterin S-methyltransferase subunit G
MTRTVLAVRTVAQLGLSAGASIAIGIQHGAAIGLALFLVVGLLFDIRTELRERNRKE